MARSAPNAINENNNTQNQGESVTGATGCADIENTHNDDSTTLNTSELYRELALCSSCHRGELLFLREKGPAVLCRGAELLFDPQ
jgi:hypothetical protein